MTSKIVVKLTPAQGREVAAVTNGAAGLRFLRFDADEYQTKAKALVTALEEQIKNYNRQLAPLTADSGYMDWTNKEDAALAHRKKVAGLRGARKACERAKEKLIFGDLDSDDPKRNLHEWQDERDNEAEKKYLEEYEHDWKENMGDKPSQYLEHIKEEQQVEALTLVVEKETKTIPLPKMGLEPLPVTPVSGLDRARELMPQIEKAKAKLGQGEYGEFLKTLGVTVDQVRQWRRRLKKARIAARPIPYKDDSKPSNQDKFRAQLKKKAVTPQPKSVATILYPLGVAISDIDVKAEEGYVVFEVGQTSEVTQYSDKRRDYREHSSKPGEWSRSVYDLDGTLSCHVLVVGADEATVAEALFVRFKEMLTRMSLWRDTLEKEYRDAATESAADKKAHAEQVHRSRSRAARAAAATRAMRKAAGQRA